MKKSILLVAALALLVTGSAFAATYENVAINAAKDAGCIQSGDNSYLMTTVEATGICFVSGETHKVSIYYNPVAHCNDTPSKPCPKPAVYIKAEVFFGCDNVVTGVTCY